MNNDEAKQTPIRTHLISIGFPIEQFEAHYGTTAEDADMRIEPHPDYIGSFLVYATIPWTMGQIKEFETALLLWRCITIDSEGSFDTVVMIWMRWVK